ncbi:MAG: chromosome segregation protein SMC [Chloroflexi bacterium]|nr:chromosome segregation protein SMC [Chloroflexota bacterium]
MRLKKLTLHGYKTFANKTDILFGEGVTAVVGPNGSGKSNIADSIRWVLGEQAYTVLRGKKTEDMIFNGSSERSRMGMAEVFITLDNADNWLPVDFDEVEIGRRAYRSGENEYFLNGNRVRLRDIFEILGRSGLGRRTHTVIGQGMIDRALALRPEDRRELFEEAAGVTLYRHKRRQTIDRLQKTQDNLVRVHDILHEIAPRLRQLEKHAERARQYEILSKELRQLLRLWYGHNWHLALGQLVDARAAVAHWQQIINRTQQTIDTYNQKTTTIRSRQNDLRGQLATWRQELATHESAGATLAREQAVGAERLRAMRSSSERYRQEIEILQERRHGEHERWQEAQAALEAMSDQLSQHKEQWLATQEALQTQQNAHQQTETELTSTQKQSFDLASRISDRQNRITQAQERRLAVQEERQAEIAAAEQAAAEALEIEVKTQRLSATLNELAAQIQGVQAKHGQTEARRQEHVAQRSRQEKQQAELNAHLRALQARYELLDRLRAEGEGMYAGVKRVMQASRRRVLHGVRGPIATLINVPDRFETAIEVALGARIQDVVVESWQDAAAAITHLKETRGGRATFLPLDNLRPLSRRQPPRHAGVLGWAADLVHYDADVAPAVELLLGQILVVTDLKAARAANQGHQRQRIVTIEGDFVHPGGSVSGGSKQKNQQSGMLAREREWRQLPAEIADTEQQIRLIQSEIEGLQRAIVSVDETLTGLVTQASGLADSERQQTQQLSKWQNNLDRARQTEAWHRTRAQKLALELENFGRSLAQYRQEIGEYRQQESGLSNRIAVLEEKLATLGTTGLVQAVAQAQARMASLDERLRAQRALVENHAARVQQIEGEISTHQQDIATLNQEIQQLQTHLQSLTRQRSAKETATLALVQNITPAQQELDQLDNGWMEHDQEGDLLHDRLHQEEMHLNQAQLQLQRNEDQLTYLRSQIEHDLGLVQLETEDGVPSQEPLPFDQIVTTLPRVQSMPDDSKSEIRRLKGLINRLGPINPEAQAEYTATQERFDFLSQQTQDLEEASAQLTKVISELDELIDQEFRRTFKAVSKAFTHYFTRLFGGGTAKLELTDPDDITNTGVEIIARPPGKRPHSLSVLSGGERALTATALIFSILSVNPTPFCVLDEIDAALDEANINRVREVLSELARQAIRGDHA